MVLSTSKLSDRKMFFIGALGRFIVSILVIELTKPEIKNGKISEKVDPILMFFLVFFFFEWIDSNIPEFIMSISEGKTVTQSLKLSSGAFVNSYRRLPYFYAFWDKINDLIISALLMSTFQVYFTKEQNIVLWVLLGYRILGCLIWVYRPQEHIFFFFPNLFEAVMLSFLIINRNIPNNHSDDVTNRNYDVTKTHGFSKTNHINYDYPASEKMDTKDSSLVISSFIVLKMIQEYFMHYKKVRF